MTLRHLQLRRLAVGGASVALAATGLVVATAPAHAASAPLDYTCTVLGSDYNMTASFAAPATVPVGGTAKFTASVVVPGDLVGLLNLVGAKALSGTGTADLTATPTGSEVGVPAAAALTLPKTDVPASGDMTVPATGSVPLPATLPVGSVLDIEAGDYTADLTVHQADGSTSGPLAVPCTLDEGQDASAGQVTVVKAGSKTKLTAKGKKKQAVITVKVASTTTVKATGKVKVSLKGPKKVTKTVKLNKKGVAKLKVKKLKKGTYKVAAKYAGDKSVKGSSAKTKVKVK